MIDKITTLILRNELEELKKTLESKSLDLNQFDRLGNAPLHTACESSAEAVEILLNCNEKIDINKKNKNGFAPIHFAVLDINTEALKILIDRGANINIKEDNGNTPLWLAVMHNDENDQTGIIKLLLDNGADPQIKNNHGNSLYKALAMPKNKDIVKLFPPEE